MIQRIIYTALQNGLSAITADNSLLDELFSNLYGLTFDELATIKTYFTNKTPGVHHGFAREDYSFPCYSIILMAESEKDMFLGDEAGGIIDEDDPDRGADEYEATWQAQYNILVYDKNVDTTQYMYEIAKSILLLSRDFFVQQGLSTMKVSGSDLQQDPKYIPAYLFVRSLQVSFVYEFNQLLKASKLGKAFKVSNIYSPVQTTGVIGGVTTL